MHKVCRELGDAGLRGTWSPTVEPDPGNAGGGKRLAPFKLFLRICLRCLPIEF
jgi:hypothetical protein